MSEQYTNLGITTLAFPYTPGMGYLIVNEAAFFPTVGLFTVNCEDVLYTVTSTNGNKFYVSLEYGTDIPHQVGVKVEEVLSARALDQIKADILASIPPPTPANNGIGSVGDEFFIATQGQTSFSPSFTVTTPWVFRNGVKQRLGESFDYIVSSGLIVFTSGLIEGDIVEIIQ
jgi:hypothetical protein